jgi:hypothetical protein
MRRLLPAENLARSRVTSVPVDAALLALLPRTDMSDSYRLMVKGAKVDAAEVAYRMFARVPSWVRMLMDLRNCLVAPLGLKAGLAGDPAAGRSIGFFPVITEMPERVLLGLDDKHLDFRIAVDVALVGSGELQVTATTLIRTHNLLGRAYLASVLPFHRAIVPAMLARAALR